MGSVETSHPPDPTANPLKDALAAATATVKKQIEAASQILDEQLSTIAARMHAYYRAESELAVAASRERQRRELSDKLNQSLRRLRHFENEEQWSRVLVDATEDHCLRSALFVVNQNNLEMRAIRNLSAASLPPVPLTSSPAFRSAVETKDTVVAMRTRGELSEPIASMLGEAPKRRSSLFPLIARDRVVAVLYADSGDGSVESSTLELIASFGAAVLTGVIASPRQTGNLHAILGTAPPASRPITWSALSKQEQDVHLRAQRFARVRAAELRLYHSQAVKEGRAHGDLYPVLKTEIDAAREAFRRDFMTGSETMVDYLHLELVRTLANDNANILGKGYPGPML